VAFVAFDAAEDFFKELDKARTEKLRAESSKYYAAKRDWSKRDD
jgi:hypothetical protein